MDIVSYGRRGWERVGVELQEQALKEHLKDFLGCALPAMAASRATGFVAPPIIEQFG